MKKPTVLHMRINANLKTALIKEAKRTNRSLANLVETALFDFLKQRHLDK